MTKAVTPGMLGGANGSTFVTDKRKKLMKTDEDARRVEETKTDLESTSQKSKFMIK